MAAFSSSSWAVIATRNTASSSSSTGASFASSRRRVGETMAGETVRGKIEMQRCHGRILFSNISWAPWRDVASHCLGPGSNLGLKLDLRSVDVGAPKARILSTEAPPNPPAEHAATPLARGATIGRYVVLGLVGRGGMGEVYAAYDPELDRKVAVKLLRVKPGNGVSLDEGRQRTLREAQAIARLSHANVVVVYDVGTFRDQVFIAMEFVEGNTVTYWLAAQPRSWQEVLRVFRAAGRGLAAAHEKGLVHRDFKPDNVMVGRDGEVRVMDFGLARQVTDKPTLEKTSPGRSLRRHDRRARPRRVSDDQMTTILLNGPPTGPPTPAGGIDSTAPPGMFELQLTRTGAMMGTPAYMAPEQFWGRRPTHGPISSASAWRCTRRSTASGRSRATRCSR